MITSIKTIQRQIFQFDVFTLHFIETQSIFGFNCLIIFLTSRTSCFCTWIEGLIELNKVRYLKASKIARISKMKWVLPLVILIVAALHAIHASEVVNMSKSQHFLTLHLLNNHIKN